MKKVIFALITISALPLKAQTVSLEYASTHRSPEEYTEIKDTNKSLTPFLGYWKGNFNGYIYEFNLKKGIRSMDFTEKGLKSDILLGRIKISMENGKVLYDTFQETDDSKIKFLGTLFTDDLEWYRMLFRGNAKTCMDIGFVNMKIKNNKLIFRYASQSDRVIGKCSNNLFYDKNEIILEKQ